jgi:hypothetical protein
MTKPIARDADADIIELCARWHITCRLSYRDLVEMMAKRGGPGFLFHDSSIGNSVRAGVRKTPGAIRMVSDPGPSAPQGPSRLWEKIKHHKVVEWTLAYMECGESGIKKFGRPVDSPVADLPLDDRRRLDYVGWRAARWCGPWQ